MDQNKTELRNNLFEKYFEVEDGILLSDLVESTTLITNTWNSLHNILKECIDDYDNWRHLEDIKEIEYKNKKYLIVKVMSREYVVIDLETKKILSKEEVVSKLEEQLFVENFNEMKDMYKFYWFLNGKKEHKIIDYYKKNKEVLNYPTRIFYKINMGDVYTFLSIRLNEGIQLSFQGKNQILYETLFINSDLTPYGMQDTKSRIGVEKMREMFDRVPNIKIPREYIPKEYLENGLVKEKNNTLVKK